MTTESEIIKKYVTKSIAVAENSSNKIFKEVKDKFLLGYITSTFGNMLEELNLSAEQIEILQGQISWFDRELQK